MLLQGDFTGNVYEVGVPSSVTFLARASGALVLDHEAILVDHVDLTVAVRLYNSA